MRHPDTALAGNEDLPRAGCEPPRTGRPRSYNPVLLAPRCLKFRYLRDSVKQRPNGETLAALVFGVQSPKFKVQNLRNRNLEKLDFSGGPNSWFDLWHTHDDWEGEGNNNWAYRERALNVLIKMYDDFKQKLDDYPGDFQLWVSIDDLDAAQDAIYIHTANPNSDNFPIKVPGDKKIRTKDKSLRMFLETTSFEVIRYKAEDGDIYYLYDREVGIDLFD